MRKATPASILGISLILPWLSTTALAANSASFVNTDTVTMGNWIGHYGADGYNVSQDGTIKNPSYAQVVLSGQNNWTWASSASTLPALQRPENPSARIAATWFSGTSFVFDVNITDGNSHNVALYALDYDWSARAETIKVLDASTGAILDSRSLSTDSFRNGTYLIWNVSGHIKFEVTRNAGANAVISGLFFGGASAVQSSSGTPTLAVPVNTFLSSLGVNTHIEQGYSEPAYEPMFQYTGIRNTRDGSNPGTGTKLVTLYQKTGVKADVFGVNISYVLSTARTVANAGALLAIEGPNEPNNWPINYNGQTGGGSGTWVPVAQYQRDLYAQVKADSTLKNYPVFTVSEPGGEVDNVGLQFLTIPAGANTIMPAGTKYADYANCHNYVDIPGHKFGNNQAWNAADPVLRGAWDGLATEYGRTWWSPTYPGYSDAQLQTLPRVTTETGWGTVGTGQLTEAQQGKLFLNVYLAQYKRGWRYTFIYQMVDSEGGDYQSQGLYHTNRTPKLSATYLHNFTTILADNVTKTPGSLSYSIPNEPVNVHDLLMQKSDGTYYLAVWGERAPGTGSDTVTVNLGGNRAWVKIYDPTIGTTATQGLNNVSSVSLTLSDHPLLVAISGP